MRRRLMVLQNDPGSIINHSDYSAESNPVHYVKCDIMPTVRRLSVRKITTRHGNCVVILTLLRQSITRILLFILVVSAAPMLLGISKLPIVSRMDDGVLVGRNIQSEKDGHFDKATNWPVTYNVCPLLYNASVCQMEVVLEATEQTISRGKQKIRYIFRYHKGAALLQGKTVSSWETTASLILIHVDTRCAQKKMAELHSPDGNNSSNGSRQVDQFVASIPRKDLILGVLYGDSKPFSSSLMKLGLVYAHREKNGKACQFVDKRGIVAFQLRRGYLGHMKAELSCTGNQSRHLKVNREIGRVFNLSVANISYHELVSKYSSVNVNKRSSSKVETHLASPPPHAVGAGGAWTPGHCVPRSHIALVIPFREREFNLWPFLDNIYRFLQLQLVAFRVFIIEQTGDVLFNRGALLNIGYREVKQIYSPDCFVFHDVDQIPEDLANMYLCEEFPRHLVRTRSSTDYRLRFPYYFGGGVMMKKEHIEVINGFPARYYGWGGEDDEAISRLVNKSVQVLRRSEEIGSYTSLPHGKDRTNPQIPRRVKNILQTAGQYMLTDGLSTLKYTVIQRKIEPLFTRIMVYIPGPRTPEEVLAIWNPLPPVLPSTLLFDKTSGAKMNDSTKFKKIA